MSVIAALDFLRQARRELEAAAEEMDLPAAGEASRRLDEAHRGLEKVIDGLDRLESDRFLNDHFQIIEVPVPAPKKHTIIGIGRQEPWQPAEAHCSCGWEVRADGHQYVGLKVVEHLGKQLDVGKWTDRANLPFTGHSA